MLGFESRFWPEDLFDVVCTDSYLPEIWTLKPEGFRDQRGEPNYLITGFVAGDAADKVCERMRGEPGLEVKRVVESKVRGIVFALTRGDAVL